MRYHNEFFAMSPEEQDNWKLSEHDEIDKQVREFVKKELGHDDDNNDHEKVYEYNAIMLDYLGIGPNKFMMNEFDWDLKTANTDSLYTYNKKYHEWQENACSDDENFDDYEKKELYNRFANWARAEVDSKFYYLNLDSLQMWIQWQLDDISYDWMEKHIPHDYVSGKDDGKKVEGGSLWDMRLDAHGLEGWYEQMRDFGYKWTSDQYNKHEELGDVVFVVDKTENIYDPSLDYIFGSLDVLKQLSFRDFIQDAEKLKGDNDVLMAYRDKVCAEFSNALDAEFEKVKKTAPNVVKLKKKMKVVMSDQALEDLGNME
ncbi:hypothetical protein MNBD_GAMMA08-1550 [hydrothermal vent metagenome]|uniref:Uncharacterized protein n=1 Tax=hydrothermal vent metagenome TaxID=652676 RepID=A0A3B0X7L9_9ZZZZ